MWPDAARKSRSSSLNVGRDSWSKNICYQRFLELMNLKAQELKMSKTNYANSHGLVNTRNRSTAYDVAVLSQHAITNPTFR